MLSLIYNIYKIIAIVQLFEIMWTDNSRFDPTRPGPMAMTA